MTETPTRTDDSTGAEPRARKLDHPSLFINRELSWLRFNDRVLDQALERDHPLLERVKFASIFASNLDEFFMIRVSGLRQQLQAGVIRTPPDGMTPSEQLSAIRRHLVPSLDRHLDGWRRLTEELAEEGIHVRRHNSLEAKQRKLLRRYYRDEVFPALTPLAFDPGHPFPHISNLSLNLAILVADPDGEERFARIKVPGFFPRLLRVPTEDAADDTQAHGLTAASAEGHFVWIEDVIAANLEDLFPGFEIVGAYPFRVTRDADQEIEEDEAGDLLTSIQENLRLRHFGSVVRLEVTGAAPTRLREVLIQNLGIAPYQVFASSSRVGLADVMELTRLDRPDLKDAPYDPGMPAALESGESIFSVLSRQDVMLYHPYDSFAPVVDFVRTAAEDPDVMAIKQTLYRVGPDSPIVQSLARARENGKQVAALVELKARFDEANNIVWARALEDAGVHVVYGVLGLKTHAKLCLVVRREGDEIARYLHVSTGNYNSTTARVYTDLGFFTTDRELCAEAARLFNALTGYARDVEYEQLLVAPGSMRAEILERIEREIEAHRAHGGGRLAFKMNALVDRQCVQALYRASQAGVQIELQVRGICCLVPGVPGVSDNIVVTSIVGRFLEHTRIYAFGSGDRSEVLVGSADLMPRNLDSRVEILFPVRDPSLREGVRAILDAHLRDTLNARQLGADGHYAPRPSDVEPLLDSQQLMLERRGRWTD